MDRHSNARCVTERASEWVRLSWEGSEPAGRRARAKVISMFAAAAATAAAVAVVEGGLEEGVSDRARSPYLCLPPSLPRPLSLSRSLFLGGTETSPPLRVKKL